MCDREINASIAVERLMFNHGLFANKKVGDVVYPPEEYIQIQKQLESEFTEDDECELFYERAIVLWNLKHNENH